MAANPKTQAPWGEYVPFVGPMTVEQFEAFPTEDGWTYELHHGRLIAMPGPGNRHAQIQTRFVLTLGNYLMNINKGILLSTSCYNLPMPGNIEELLCPDLSYIEPSRRATMSLRRSYLVGAPDLVIEIASPGDTHPEMATKCGIYLRAGVRLIWVAWPTSRTIEIWRPASLAAPSAILTETDM